MIGLQALHLVARVALRLQPPRRAKRIVDMVGRLLPRYRGAADASRAAVRLERSGTCLSRSLALCARCAGGEVVIGVEAGGARPLLAHAWVELGGQPLSGVSHLEGREIARLS